MHLYDMTPCADLLPEIRPFGKSCAMKLNGTLVWRFFDEAKRRAVLMGFSDDERRDLKAECDDLFSQATGCSVCPAWWIGGWG